MSIEGFVLALILLFIVALWIALPVLRPAVRGNKTQNIEKQRLQVLAYYERILTNIRDLDEDHSTGKISMDEYARERENWIQRGIRVLQFIEHLEQNEMPASGNKSEAIIDETIEQKILKYRESVFEKT